MVSREQILINGVPTRIHGSFERTVQDESGQTVAEMEAVVIVRGRLPNKQFLQQISRETVQLEITGRSDAGHDGDPGDESHGGRQRRG